MFKKLTIALLLVVALGCGSNRGGSTISFPPESEVIAVDASSLVANIASTSPASINGGYTFTLLSNPSDIANARQLGETELRKYPKRILTGLDKVHFVYSLQSDTKQEVGGIQIGSMKGTVFVVYYDYDREYTKGTVHHELMHLFNFQYKPMPSNWPNPTSADKAINPSDWNALAMAGYTRIYGTTSAAEDIATFAEGLFTGYSGFWYKYNSQLYPKFNEKANMAMEYLRSIDSRFTLEYFKSASNGGNFNGQ